MEIRVRSSVDRNSRGYTVSGTVEMQDTFDLDFLVSELSLARKSQDTAKANMIRLLEGAITSLRTLTIVHTEALMRDLEARFPLVVKEEK